MDISEIAVEQTPRPLRMNEPQLRARHTVDPDAALVERLRRAEAGAAEGLVDTYGDRVYRLALRITGNEQDAEVAVQDVFWSVVRKIDTFRGESLLGSWIYRITANAAFQKLRRTAHRRDEISLATAKTTAHRARLRLRRRLGLFLSPTTSSVDVPA